MIAYFGILSVIPASFLLITTLAWAGFLDTQGYIAEQLRFIMTDQGADTIIDGVVSLQDSGSLGVLGIVGLVWGTSNFFSSIESALNIVYGVNNRVFLKQKIWTLFLMMIALVCMTIGVVVSSLVFPLLLARADQFANGPFEIRDRDAILSLFVSMIFSFGFLLSSYRFLPNASVSVRDCWKGAFIGSVLFEITIHVLPIYLTSSGDGVVVKAFAGALIVLVWFYLAALILLIGGCINWWTAERRRLTARGDDLRWSTAVRRRLAELGK
jgi:membrane protein